MARQKEQQQRTKKPRSAGGARGSAGKRSSVWASRMRAVTILLVVGGVAIFSGYAVGNYAMDWFFGSDKDRVTTASSGTGGSISGGTTTGGGGAPSGGGSGTGSNTPTQSDETVTGQVASGSGGDLGASQGGSTSGGSNGSIINNTGSNPASGTATTSTSESEVLYRVRVGAFATREEAEPVLEPLTETGFPDAYIVKSDDGAAYHIQVGAFSTHNSAFEVEERLRSAGFAVYIETVQRR